MTGDGATNTPYAFLITQIGSPKSRERRWADDVRELVVLPVLTDANLADYRSDLDSQPGPIGSQMVSRLAESLFVIADLTGRNPNVYYETGIAHALTKPVIVLVDDVSSLPFDTQDERAIELEGADGVLTASGARKARDMLAKAVQKVRQADYVPRNVVTTAAYAMKFEDIAAQSDTVSVVAGEISSLRDGLDAVSRDVQTLLQQRQPFLTSVVAGGSSGYFGGYDPNSLKISDDKVVFTGPIRTAFTFSPPAADDDT